MTLLTSQNTSAWYSSFAEEKKLTFKNAHASVASCLLWCASINVLILMVPQEAGNCRNSHYIHRELKYGKGKLICLWKYRKSVAQVEFKHTSAGLVSQSERCVCIFFPELAFCFQKDRKRPQNRRNLFSFKSSDTCIPF